MNSKTQIEMTELESLQSAYSDIFKDVNGIRPRDFASLSADDLRSEIHWFGTILEMEKTVEMETNDHYRQTLIEAGYKAQQNLSVSMADFFKKAS